MEKQTTQEIVNLKAEELSVKHGSKITPFVFKLDDDSPEVIGYIKQPSRAMKLRMMDKSITGSYTAASEVYDAIILKEESDPRLTSDAPENDVYYMGGVMEAYKTVEMAINTLKKN